MRNMLGGDSLDMPNNVRLGVLGHHIACKSSVSHQLPSGQ